MSAFVKPSCALYIAEEMEDFWVEPAPRDHSWVSGKGFRGHRAPSPSDLFSAGAFCVYLFYGPGVVCSFSILLLKVKLREDC